MDLQQAKNLIQGTFNDSFDRSKFIQFIKELLNKIDESKRGRWAGQMIKGGFGDDVKYYERIGTYTAPEGEKIDILVVHLKKESTLERARTKQRNFVAHHLKTRAEKDAGLVAFVSPNADNWRFSLVKMDYSLEESEAGKVKAHEELTPSKRFSFIVGKNENSHTAQKQLLPILKDDEHSPTLKEIEKAFSIETVTKEFFNKYKDLFLNFKEELDKIIGKDSKVKSDFEAKGINTADFAKKLLGQVVFLYFLQRKGWLGVDKNQDWGQGPKNFLRALLDKKYCEYKNFFNEVLEPLFYEALATDRGEKAYYSRFDCRIPFLNGGLFEPLQNYDWENTDITIPNDLFSNDYKTKEGDTGSGILDFFDRYNFTIKEDEPLEKEVAIDPEMLGKVFENLLEIKDRKSKGAYYTPREIVHYMCQESLINYLATELEGKVPRGDIETFIHLGDFAVEHDMAKTQGIIKDDGKYKLPKSIHEYAELIDQKLADITVCDPAIGSGAFPVGMMNEIVRARGALNATKAFEKNKTKRTPYFFKRHAIQNSLYGVDIDPGAVEIAKLRLWLSLVVDEEEMTEIKPLPNLDYKIMQGNSLLEEYEGIKLFDESLIMDTEKIKKERLEEIRKKKSEFQQEYFRLHSDGKLTDVRKAEIEREMKTLNKEEATLTKVQIEQSGSLFEGEGESKQKAEELNRLHKEFFNVAQKSRKSEIKKKIEALEWELIEETLKEQGKEKELPKLTKMKMKNDKPFFLWKLHFAEVFQGKGGFDVVIANPPYVKEYIEKNAFDGLRNSPYYQGKMDLWYFFACKGIDLAKGKSGIITFIAQNNWVTSFGASKMRNKVINDTKILSLLDFGDFKIFENAGIQTMVMIFSKDSLSETYSFDYRRLKGADLQLSDTISLLNKNKSIKAEYLSPQISRKAFVNKKFTFTNSIIESVLDKIASKSNFQLSDKEVANGIHHHHDKLNKERKEILGAHYKVGNGIFVLSNEEKGEIPFTKEELELIKPSYTTKELYKWYGNKQNQEWVIYTDSSFKDLTKIEDYPHIKEHLDQFKKVITSDNKPYGLHRSRNEDFFKGEKIIVARKCASPCFTYTDFDSYVSATFYVIKTGRINQKYLVGLLNSSLIAFWLKHKGKMQGNNYQIDKEPLIDLPIISTSEGNQKKVIYLVEQIISISQSEHQEKHTKVHNIERKIDELIYRFYELRPEEIQIIENS